MLEQRLRRLHKLHPRDIELWGGEAMLSDRLAIEGLLEVMEREQLTKAAAELCRSTPAG